MPTRTITVSVTEWPDAEHFLPDDPRWQWDLEIDGEWVAGGTGPADAVGHAYYGVEAAADHLRENVGPDA